MKLLKAVDVAYFFDASIGLDVFTRFSWRCVNMECVCEYLTSLESQKHFPCIRVIRLVKTCRNAFTCSLSIRYRAAYPYSYRSKSIDRLIHQKQDQWQLVSIIEVLGRRWHRTTNMCNNNQCNDPKHRCAYVMWYMYLAYSSWIIRVLPVIPGSRCWHNSMQAVH